MHTGAPWGTKIKAQQVSRCESTQGGETRPHLCGQWSLPILCSWRAVSLERSLKTNVKQEASLTTCCECASFAGAIITGHTCQASGSSQACIHTQLIRCSLLGAVATYSMRHLTRGCNKGMGVADTTDRDGVYRRTCAACGSCPSCTSCAAVGARKTCGPTLCQLCCSGDMHMMSMTSNSGL